MIYNAMFTSQSGIQGASVFLDVTANNVANFVTPGYKTAQVNFEDMLYNGLQPAKGQPGDTQVGTGTGLASITGIFTQGPLNQTGVPTDLAINGGGFFQVTLSDGTLAYTRNGSFQIDASGQLVTPQGAIVSPAITVPTGTSTITVGTDGTVTAITGDGPVPVGQITLARFPNQSGLLRIGDTLYAQTVASGAAVTGTPGSEGFGTIQQGALEGSNVNLTTELVQLIVATRTFQFNSEASAIENSTMATTVDLIPLTTG